MTKIERSIEIGRPVDEANLGHLKDLLEAESATA
jgi:hypothetical protein